MISNELIYRSLFEQLADGIVVSDTDGKIVCVNAAALKLFGKDDSQLVGQPIASVIEIQKDESNANGNASEPQMASVLGKAGSQLSLPVSQIELMEGKAAKGHLSIIYITPGNSVQQAQTDFVSTVSHELRTPLTSIKGFADTILRAQGKLDASQQKRYVGIIKDQADRLTRLVEDLLAVSRLESKKLQLTIRAVDLSETIERVQRNLVEKASNHKITVDTAPGLPQVWADADRLEQILTNLVDNAIKYSPPKTVVTVKAKTIFDEGKEMIELDVIDQGAGIESDQLPKIFAKFSRLDSPLVRQTEGTGLGLYITRSLVLALGGDISVASQPGRTTFTVKLPVASREKQAALGRDRP